MMEIRLRNTRTFIFVDRISYCVENLRDYLPGFSLYYLVIQSLLSYNMYNMRGNLYFKKSSKADADSFVADMKNSKRFYSVYDKL
jgi:hypothetical protein